MTVRVMRHRWGPFSWVNRLHLGFLCLQNILHQSSTRHPSWTVRIVLDKIVVPQRADIAPWKCRSLSNDQMNEGRWSRLLQNRSSRMLEILGKSRGQMADPGISRAARQMFITAVATLYP